MKRILSVAFLVAIFSVSASADTCIGTCGTDPVPDGGVTVPPNGASVVNYVSTTGSTDTTAAAAALAALGLPAIFTNGSVSKTSTFSVGAGETLEGFYNYVTSDGNGFPDTAFAELFTSGGTAAGLLFSAQTTASGSTAPGFAVTGGPSVDATLTPPSATTGGVGPVWSAIGPWSGMCFTSPGCGLTGWMQSDFTEATAGSYYIEYGVANAHDQLFDSGLAFTTTTVPEPSTLMLLGTALLGLGGTVKRKFSS